MLLICQLLYLADELVSYWLIGKRRWWAWAIKAGGLIPLTAINIWCHLYVFHLVNALLLALYARNLVLWLRSHDATTRY